MALSQVTIYSMADSTATNYTKQALPHLIQGHIRCIRAPLGGRK